MTCETIQNYRPNRNIDTACELAGITTEDAKSHNKNRGLAYRRFHVMSIMRSWGRSLPQIARILGCRDHTTVLKGIRRWEEIKDLPLPPVSRVAVPRPPKPIQKMVYWSTYKGAWEVRITRTHGGFIGSFLDYDEAVKARDAALATAHQERAA